MSDKPDITAIAAESADLLNQLSAILGGKGPQLQGIVLAEATAVWLLGHAPELRDRLIDLHIEGVRGFIKARIASGLTSWPEPTS